MPYALFLLGLLVLTFYYFAYYPRHMFTSVCINAITVVTGKRLYRGLYVEFYHICFQFRHTHNLH